MDPEPLDEADDEPTGSSAAMPSMSAPSIKEKEEHFVSHFPFRAWCEHCVRGKAKAMKHVRVDHSEEQVPVISVDYCFMNSKDDTVITEDTQSKHSPVLVVRDRWTRMVFAHVLPYKGVQKGPVGSKCLLNDLRKLGYPKMIVRYDPEPALQAVVEAAKNGFQGQLILEKIPVGVSESKGEIERAVQTIEGQSRTLRSALETSYGSKIGDDSVILTWLVEHAGTLHNLFHRSGEMKDVRHLTPDTEVVSGEFLFHHLERQLSFSREATSSNQGGNKVFFLESRTTQLRRLLEMDPVFSPCNLSEGSLETTSTTWRFSSQ